MKVCKDCDNKVFNDDISINNSSNTFCKNHYLCFARYTRNDRCKNYRYKTHNGFYDLFCDTHKNNSQYYKYLYKEKKDIDCRNLKSCNKIITESNCKKNLKQLLECDLITRRSVYMIHVTARDELHEFFISKYIDKSINKINEQSYDYLIKKCKDNCNNYDLKLFMKSIRQEYKQKLSNIRQNKKIENYNNKY